MNVHKTSLRKRIIPLAIFVLILVAFFAWVAHVPHPPRPDVAVGLLGYTNDASGNRLAKIVVTNLSSFTVFVYQPQIQIKTRMQSSGFTNYFQRNTNLWFYSMLADGASTNFTIPPPPQTFQAPWRLSFFVYSDFGAAQLIKRLVRQRRYMPFTIASGWFGSKK